MRQDKVIAILKGNGGAKRAARKAQVELTVMCGRFGYTIQANGKTVEEANGDEHFARERAEERAKGIRALGKTCTITIF